MTIRCGVFRAHVEPVARRAERLMREIERLQAADRSDMGRGVQLARNAQKLFAKREPREKRRLLNFLLSNCTWEDGNPALRQPFDLRAETALTAARAAAGEAAL